MTDDVTAFQKPPGPEGPIALGIDPETLLTLRELQADFGDMVSVVQPRGRLAYFVNEAKEVQRILTRRHAKYRKGPGFERVKMLLGNGLIVSDGDVWRRSRTMIQPAFGRQNVHRLVELMDTCRQHRADHWHAVAKAGDSLNITEECSEFSLELILVSIFGDDYYIKIMGAGGNPFAFLSKNSTRDLSVVLKVRELRQMLLEIIAERRANQKERPFDFLGMYLQASDKQGVAFTDNELLDELMTLIVAGFETAANTLSWAWYLLARHSDVDDKLLEEAKRQMPIKDSVTADALQAMPYTQQVLEETLRLYPPVWLFTRRTQADDELDEFDIPVGTDVYLSPLILHRSERYWPNPDEFDPDRFALSTSPKKDLPYFPFSLGPRRCLGEYFSFLEMKVHLGRLLQQFKLLPIDDSEPGLDLAINLRAANDIMLRPILR